MLEFFRWVTSTWWGILTVSVILLLIFVTLSSLLYKVFFKRLYDILFSSIAIILLSPLFLVLIILGAIKMKGNPFFCQARPGIYNKKTGQEKVFKIVKFRTMTCAKDENGNDLPDDRRITKYGKILRRTSLDELPEIFNVFIGQMSLVGPRPLLIKDKIFMSDEIRKRHTVRGGITGLAQVSGRNNISWIDKFNYDLQYVSKVSLWQDIKILFMTVIKVFMKSDIEREGTVSDIDYGDWLLKEGLIDSEKYAQILNGKER